MSELKLIYTVFNDGVKFTTLDPLEAQGLGYAVDVWGMGGVYCIPLGSPPADWTDGKPRWAISRGGHGDRSLFGETGWKGANLSTPEGAALAKEWGEKALALGLIKRTGHRWSTQQVMDRILSGKTYTPDFSDWVNACGRYSPQVMKPEDRPTEYVEPE